NKDSVHLFQYKKEQKNDYVSIIYTPSDFKENSDDLVDFFYDSTFIKKRLLTTIEHQFKLIITREILKSIPTKVFISSVERTGIAIFKEELDDLVDKNEDFFGFIEPNKDVFKGNYPSAVKDNINSVKKYHRLQESSIQSELSKESPFILKYFQEIINGEYVLDDAKKSIKYIPRGEHGSQKSLSLIESSSSVRSLLDIGIYIQYFAEKGQTLIIDEPEMNLHPYNQRKVARLIAMLVNYGINVLITTHSDFITREISFLIMMKDEKRKYLLEQEPKINIEYYASQLLSADSVKVYSSDYNLETKSVSINAEKVSSDDGFSIPTFDDTVDRMNEVYNMIL
ncbi:TPA: AAA family ATPase, partial [Pasteurella multocida]|nr:AAA family ATPase [Pasteurella multocida]